MEGEIRQQGITDAEAAQLAALLAEGKEEEAAHILIAALRRDLGLPPRPEQQAQQIQQTVSGDSTPAGVRAKGGKFAALERFLQTRTTTTDTEGNTIHTVYMTMIATPAVSWRQWELLAYDEAGVYVKVPGKQVTRFFPWVAIQEIY